MKLDQFIKQAKVNVRNDEHFIEANEYYYAKTEEEEYLPAPKEYISSLYKKKGITNTITSALSVFGLTSAILSFDWVSMLTYLFTIVFSPLKLEYILDVNILAYLKSSPVDELRIILGEAIFTVGF